MIIRKATKKDIPEIIRLFGFLNDRFEELESQDSLDKKYYRSRKQYNEIKTQLEQRKFCFFIAKIEKKSIGFLSVEIKKNWEGFVIKKRGHFSILVVDPIYRKKGVAKGLIKNAYSWFRKRNIKNYSVSTNAFDKKANNFWKYFGFTPTKVTLAK